MWSRSVTLDGDRTFSVCGQCQDGQRGPCLSFSMEEAQALGPDGIAKVFRWFTEEGQEFADRIWRDLQRPKPTTITPKPRSREGTVYVLAADDGSRRFKIGRTSQPVIRRQQLGTKLPFTISLAAAWKAEDSYATERELHEQFEEQRLEGEWFELSDDDLAWIRERYLPEVAL